ncbi:MAG: hypothetical protein Q4C04_04420 [Clostridia bacterium]|nr:hypothetical protein [Clostridia bacterium]
MYGKDIVLEIVKSRMDRGGVTVPPIQLAYWLQRIEAAAQELERMGLALTDCAADNVLLADYTVWKINNRDTTGEMPSWLRRALRNRWLGAEVSTDATD